MCRNRRDIAGLGKWQYCVKCTAILEGASVLEVFTLEYDPTIHSLVEAGGTHHRRAYEPRTDAIRRCRDVRERGNGGGVRLHRYPRTRARTTAHGSASARQWIHGYQPVPDASPASRSSPRPQAPTGEQVP